MSLSLEEVLAALPKRLQKVFEDPSVTELMINSPSSVWFEKEGCLYPVLTVKTPRAEALTERMLDTTVKRIARPLGFDADKKAPIVDARLPDGSRVAIACPPITESFALSIRRFGSRPWTAAKLVETGAIPEVILTLIAEALNQRENIIISGGTGTGKTTMLSAFASLIDEEERIVCIEDTRELHIPAPNCLHLEAKSSPDNKNSFQRHPSAIWCVMRSATVRTVSSSERFAARKPKTSSRPSTPATAVRSPPSTPTPRVLL